MKTRLVLFFSFLLVSACGPSANFSGDDRKFSSLMDGETVELVSEQQLDQVLDLDVPNSPVLQETPDVEMDEPIVVMDDSDDDDHPMEIDIEEPRPRRGMRCRPRLLEQGNRRQFNDMMASPRELFDKDVQKFVRCGKKKVKVCHYPNDDDSKKRTLCVGLKGLKRLVLSTRSKNFLGQCNDDDEDADSETNDNEADEDDDEEADIEDDESSDDGSSEAGDSDDDEDDEFSSFDEDDDSNYERPSKKKKSKRKRGRRFLRWILGQLF